MPDLLHSLSAGFADLVARAAPAVVTVQSHRSRASGFLWRPGLVVAGVLPGGATLPAERRA